MKHESILRESASSSAFVGRSWKNTASGRIARWPGVVLAALFITPFLYADPITVTAAVAPDGALFSYNYTITDNLSPDEDDVVLIDISVPAVPGSISNLTTPPGFESAFDSGLGLVSFLEDSDSFGSTPISGFSFDSANPPAAGTFQATVLSLDDFSLFTIDGDTVAPGGTGPSPVPEPSTLLLTASSGSLLELLRRLKAKGRLSTLKKQSVLGLLLTMTAFASGQSIHQDANANISDVYAFIGEKFDDNSVKVLNVVVNIHPFSNGGDALTYDRFSDDVLYTINIANPQTGTLITSYNFRFSPVSSAAGTYKNLSTIFSYGRGTTIGSIASVNGTSQNFTQTYSVTKVVASSGNSTTIGSDFLVPPPNVGVRVTPFYNDSSGFPLSGATTNAGLDMYTRQTIYPTTTGSGETVWAGPREDGFFGDMTGIGDLFDPRILGPDGHGQTGNGIDSRAGQNVLTISMQIPVSSLPLIQYMDAFTGTSHGVGVYASTSRQRLLLRSTSGDPTGSGPWIQISRAGNPLFSDLFIGQRDKDNYSRDLPTGDSMFAAYTQSPELPVLLNAVYGTSFTTTGRADLAAIYIPDVLRVDTTTAPVPLIGQGGNRLSGFGGDTTGGKWSGWPNGRRFGDDVIDIMFTAVASGPSYHTIFLLGDNVNHNDQTYNFVFPYAATPNPGAR